MLDAIRRAVRRTDSWLNALTGVGLNRGRNALSFRATASDYLDDVTLEQLYELDGLAARIVRAPCVHALRRGFAVTTGDPEVDTRIKGKLDDLDAVNALRKAWQWARLYGGGAVFVGADDGRDPREPLDMSAIRSVRFAVDVDRIELIPQEWETDPLSPRFGKPRTYLIIRNATGGGAQNAVVHASRVIRFDGVEPTRRRRQTLQGWGDSVLQRVYVDLQQARGAYAAVAGLLHESSQGVFKMKDLMLMMAGDADDTLKRRMEAMDMSRSVARAILIDADGESYERIEVGALTGLVDAMDRFTNMVSASSEIPVTVLMGQAPAGLNATGESDIRSWYDAVEAEREAMLRSRVERMVRLVMLAHDGPAGGQEPAGWKVTFPPLWQPTPGELADLRLKVAQGDQAYVTIGSLTPEEVALARFQPDGLTAEITIDLEARKASMAGGMGEPEGGDEGGPDGAPDGTGGPGNPDKAAQDGASGSSGAPLDHEAVAAIIDKVAARKIPRDAGVALLARLVGEGDADRTMGEAGKSFFTAPEMNHAAELEAARAEAAAAKRSQQSTKAMLSRVLERNRAGELVVKPIGPGAERAAEDIEPGDVVQVAEEPGEGEPDEASAEPAADGRGVKADGADDPAGVPVAVVLPLPALSEQAYAILGDPALHAQELHMTLAFLGRRVLSDEQAAVIVSTVRKWAEGLAPIPALLNGVGRFAGTDPAKGDPVYLSVDAPRVTMERPSLVKALRDAGFPPASDHGFVPHVTIAYVPADAPTPVARVEPIEVRFPVVALWAGDRRIEVPLASDYDTPERAFRDPPASGGAA